MKKSELIYLSFLVIVFTSNAAALSQQQTLNIKQTPRALSIQNGDSIYRIVKAHENTYGYEILLNNTVVIRQLTIPGIQGTQGFKKKADAEKVAKLVVQKIKKGMMPPTIRQKELEDLKIFF